MAFTRKPGRDSGASKLRMPKRSACMTANRRGRAVMRSVSATIPKRQHEVRNGKDDPPHPTSFRQDLIHEALETSAARARPSNTPASVAALRPRSTGALPAMLQRLCSLALLSCSGACHTVEGWAKLSEPQHDVGAADAIIPHGPRHRPLRPHHRVYAERLSASRRELRSAGDGTSRVRHRHAFPRGNYPA